MVEVYREVIWAGAWPVWELAAVFTDHAAATAALVSESRRQKVTAVWSLRDQSGREISRCVVREGRLIAVIV